jgi:hypothetical protein
VQADQVVQAARETFIRDSQQFARSLEGDKMGHGVTGGGLKPNPGKAERVF